MDLFASHLIPQYFSWSRDPEAEAMNAFSQQWDEIGGEANPPWQNPIPSTSSESGLSLDSTSMENAGVVPHSPGDAGGLIQPTTPLTAPEVEPQLAAWPISGNSTETSRFLTQAQNCYSRHGGQSHPNHTTPFSENGCAGVVGSHFGTYK